MIISRPHDAGFIDPRNSIAPMLDALDAIPGQVTIEFCEPPTPARLEEMISEARKQKRPFHIDHFDGHGSYLKGTGVGAPPLSAVQRRPTSSTVACSTSCYLRSLLPWIGIEIRFGLPSLP